VLPISGSTFTAAGSDHNIIITSQGKAYSWGFNTNYQCGQGSDMDEASVATLIDNSAVRDKKLSWAGAGGQYSLLAGPHQQSDKLPNEWCPLIQYPVSSSLSDNPSTYHLPMQYPPETQHTYSSFSAADPIDKRPTEPARAQERRTPKRTWSNGTTISGSWVP
jgi:hypothetical protein